MTIEERYVFDVSDLQAVRLQCSTCGAAISLKVSAWSEPQYQCPGCGVQWFTKHSEPYKTALQLAAGLRGMKALMEKENGLSFRVRFEIDLAVSTKT